MNKAIQSKPQDLTSDTSATDVCASLQSAAENIAAAGAHIYQRGWVPATSGNFSQRLDKESFAITVSGRHKGQLTSDDVMRVTLDSHSAGSQTCSTAKPSAETLLHTQLYRRDAAIGAILHTHSLYSVLVSQAAFKKGEAVFLQGLELLKAFSGITTHETVLRLPVFANSQDMVALSEQVDAEMNQHGCGHAYLISGHGVYTWGRDMAEAMRQLEAIEYLLEYTWRVGEKV